MFGYIEVFNSQPRPHSSVSGKSPWPLTQDDSSETVHARMKATCAVRGTRL